MTTNYSQDPTAVKSHEYYYSNREKLLAYRKSRYASNLEIKKAASEATKKWRQKNPEYSHAMERLRSKIRYWTRSSKPIAAEMVKSLKIEKRLLQMSKENRKNPMTYLPSV